MCNSPVIGVTMNKSAVKVWGNMTAECAPASRSIAIVVNGQVFCVPVPLERIKGGKCVISGDFIVDEFKTIAKALK